MLYWFDNIGEVYNVCLNLLGINLKFKYWFLDGEISIKMNSKDYVIYLIVFFYLIIIYYV